MKMTKSATEAAAISLPDGISSEVEARARANLAKAPASIRRLAKKSPSPALFMSAVNWAKVEELIGG